jgi:hypothetical protein
MAKSLEKIKARKLRKEGKSINAIADKLAVSKSTVSLWCQDIPLNERQREKLFINMVRGSTRGRAVGTQSNKDRREGRIRYWTEKAQEEIGILTKRDMLIAATALHWGEGSKGRKFAFSNSDPQMILFIYQWLTRYMDIQKKDITVRVLINIVHKPRIEIVLKFWTDLLKLQPEQMYKPTFIRSKNKKIYENHERYYGTVSLRVKKSTDFQYHLLGLVGALKYKPV